ncbi:MAG: hypothetical protein N4A40_01885 [Tissierellales bacterium]|nr:hypothetical protein [Tissierellales bacterium]
MKKFKIFTLFVLILTILAVPSFAGSWNNISFNEIVRNNHNYLLGEFDSTGQPYLDLWVNPSSGSKDLTVYLVEVDSTGTITAMIDQKTWHAGSNQTIHDVWHQSNILRGHYAYILSFQGSTTRIDGKVAYFK